MVLSRHRQIQKEEPLLNKDLVDTGQAKRSCHIPQWIPDVQNGARNLLFDNDEKPTLGTTKIEDFSHMA